MWTDLEPRLLGCIFSYLRVFSRLQLVQMTCWSWRHASHEARRLKQDVGSLCYRQIIPFLECFHTLRLPGKTVARMQGRLHRLENLEMYNGSLHHVAKLLNLRHLSVKQVEGSLELHNYPHLQSLRFHHTNSNITLVNLHQCATLRDVEVVDSIVTWTSQTTDIHEVNLNSLKVTGMGGLQFLVCFVQGKACVRSLEMVLVTTTTPPLWPRNLEHLSLDFCRMLSFIPWALPALPTTVKHLTVLNGDSHTRLYSSTTEVRLSNLDLVNDYGDSGCTGWPFSQRVSADSATMTLSVLSAIGDAYFGDLVVYSEGEKDVLPHHMNGFWCLRFTLRGHRFMSSKETMRFLRAVPSREIVLESCTYRDDIDLEAHLTPQKGFSFEDVKRGFQAWSHEEMNGDGGYPSAKRQRRYEIVEDDNSTEEDESTEAADYPSSSGSDSDSFSDGEMM